MPYKFPSYRERKKFFENEIQIKPYMIIIGVVFLAMMIVLMYSTKQEEIREAEKAKAIAKFKASYVEPEKLTFTVPTVSIKRYWYEGNLGYITKREVPE